MATRTAQDAATVGAKALAAGASGVTLAPTVAALLTAAGVAGATTPVVGWILAGGMAAAAGTIALVQALRSAKVRRDEAVAMAEQLGIPDAAEVPGFVTRALEWDPAKRNKEMGQVAARLQKGRYVFRKQDKDISRLRILAAIDLIERAAARGAAPPPAPAATREATYGPPPMAMTVGEPLGISPWWWLTGGVAGVVLLAILARRR